MQAAFDLSCGPWHRDRRKSSTAGRRISAARKACYRLPRLRGIRVRKPVTMSVARQHWVVSSASSRRRSVALMPSGSSVQDTEGQIVCDCTAECREGGHRAVQHVSRNLAAKLQSRMHAHRMPILPGIVRTRQERSSAGAKGLYGMQATILKTDMPTGDEAGKAGRSATIRQNRRMRSFEAAARHSTAFCRVALTRAPKCD